MEEAVKDLENDKPKEILFDIGADKFTFTEVMMMIAGENEDAKMCVEAFNEEDREQYENLKRDFESPENKETIAKILEGQKRGQLAESEYADKLYKQSGLYKRRQKQLDEVNRKKDVAKKARKKEKANKKKNR